MHSGTNSHAKQCYALARYKTTSTLGKNSKGKPHWQRAAKGCAAMRGSWWKELPVDIKFLGACLPPHPPPVGSKLAPAIGVAPCTAGKAPSTLASPMLSTSSRDNLGRAVALSAGIAVGTPPPAHRCGFGSPRPPQHKCRTSAEQWGKGAGRAILSLGNNWTAAAEPAAQVRSHRWFTSPPSQGRAWIQPPLCWSALSAGF
jgi:hypothetical protein